MTELAKIVTILSVSALLAGCMGTDEVLFVTDTNIGIDADSKPPNLQIAYSRVEGYIGPSYDNGALPSVVARIQSNLSAFNPVIHQTYATGDAAVSLSRNSPIPPQDRELGQRNKRIAYFTTESSLGLRVTFGESAVPDSVHLGYKRKEFSYVPIGSKAGGCRDKADSTPRITDKYDCYGSVLANIELGGQISTAENTGVQLNQLFATGSAAEYLASENIAVRGLFAQQIFETDISQEYSCDENCQKIRTFGAMNDAAPAVVRTKCLAPNKIRYLTDLLNLTRNADARAKCVQALGQ